LPNLQSLAGSSQSSPNLQPLAGEWWFNAWEIQTKVWPLSQGTGATIGLLDSGVQANLPDLRGAIVSGGDTTGAGTNGMTDDYQNQDGHGTAMAALIVGQGVDGGLVGIAPKAKILPVRVGGLNNTSFDGTTATIAAGIRYAVSRGVQVINMSLGQVTSSASGCDPVLQAAVAYALQHNVVVVASAGDSGTASAGNPAESPASCAGVLAVGGVNPNLTLWTDSEVQPYVAVAAPGNEIGFLGLDGKYFPDGYGTSQAAAFVSGEAALVRSRYPSMPWYQVEQRIINTALPEGGSVPNNSFGYGIVRIARALDLSAYPIPSSDPNPVYSAYQVWLSSQQHAPTPGPTMKAVLRVSSGGVGGLAVLIGVVVGVVAVGAVLFVGIALRRRRRSA
jgi:type VII secretion-associated serine protease mycosin